MLKGWITFRFAGVRGRRDGARRRLPVAAGRRAAQRVARSDDLELIEINLPAEFGTCDLDERPSAPRVSAAAAARRERRPRRVAALAAPARRRDRRVRRCCSCSGRYAVRIFGIKEYLLPPPSKVWTEFLKRYDIVMAAPG